MKPPVDRWPDPTSMEAMDRLSMTTRQYYKDMEYGESELVQAAGSGCFDRCAVCRSLPMLCQCEVDTFAFSQQESEDRSRMQPVRTMLKGELLEGGRNRSKVHMQRADGHGANASVDPNIPASFQSPNRKTYAQSSPHFAIDEPGALNHLQFLLSPIIWLAASDCICLILSSTLTSICLSDFLTAASH